MRTRPCADRPPRQGVCAGSERAGGVIPREVLEQYRRAGAGCLLAQSGPPSVQFTYVAANPLPVSGLFTPNVAVLVTTDQPGNAFLVEVTYTDGNGQRQNSGKLVVTRAQPVMPPRSHEPRAPTGIGQIRVPVGSGATAITVFAWNITVGAVGQSF
jgi:hypothetical protein